MFANFDITSWLLAVLYRIPGIIIGLSFHEWAHAYAAFKRGDPTARNLGRMTANPAAHIDPIGILMLLVVGFGWAKPVPINTRNFKNPRKDEIIVSLAGVITNLAIAFVFTGIWIAVAAFAYNEIAVNLLMNVVVINLALFVFNLLPVPPLDGYHVAQCLLMRKISYKFFQFIERYGTIILIAVLILNSNFGFLSYVVQAILNGFASAYSWLFGLFM